jgi:hypothetical protein
VAHLRSAKVVNLKIVGGYEIVALTPAANSLDDLVDEDSDSTI